MKLLSARRSKDREAMAKQIAELSEKHGFTCARDEILSDGHQVILSIETLRGLCVGIDLDGGCQIPDTFVLRWHFREPNGVRLNPDCWLNVNTCHFRKATVIAEGFDSLLHRLKHIFKSIKNGFAFRN